MQLEFILGCQVRFRECDLPSDALKDDVLMAQATNAVIIPVCRGVTTRVHRWSVSRTLGCTLICSGWSCGDRKWFLGEGPTCVADFSLHCFLVQFLMLCLTNHTALTGVLHKMLIFTELINTAHRSVVYCCGHCTNIYTVHPVLYNTSSTFQSTCRATRWPHSVRFSVQLLARFTLLSHACYMLSPAHVVLHPIILMLFEEQHRRESPRHARLAVFCLRYKQSQIVYSPFTYLAKDSSLPIKQD
jgi:hypothetical protein